MEINNKLKDVKKRYNNLYKKCYRGSKLISKDEMEEMEKLRCEQQDLEKIVAIFNQLLLPVHQTISKILKLSKGEKFKTYVTFQELINYKTEQQSDWYAYYYGSGDDKETTKFKRFISFIDELQYNLRFIYPFIDLEGVNLGWTTDQLTDYIFDAYFTMPQITVADIEKKRQEAGRESLADKIVEDMRNSKK